MILSRAGIGKVGKDTELALAMYYRSSVLTNYVVPYSRLEDSNKLQERATRATNNFRNYTRKVVRTYMEGIYRRQDQIIRTSSDPFFHAWLDNYYDTWFRRNVAPMALLLPELWVMVVPMAGGGFKPIVIFPSFVHDFILAANGEVLSFTVQIGNKMMRIDHNEVIFFSSNADSTDKDWIPEEPMAHGYGFCPVVRIVFEENAEIEDLDGTPVGHAFMHDVIYDNLADLQLRSMLIEAIHDHMYYQMVVGEDTLSNTVRRGMGSDVPIAESADEKGTTRFLSKPALEINTLRNLINEDMPTRIFEDARVQSRFNASAQTGAARAYDLYPENGVLTEISNHLWSADERIVGMLATMLRVRASVQWPSVFDTRTAGDLLDDATKVANLEGKFPFADQYIRNLAKQLQHVTLPGADTSQLKMMDDQTQGTPIPFMPDGQTQAGDKNLPPAQSRNSQSTSVASSGLPASGPESSAQGKPANTTEPKHLASADTNAPSSGQGNGSLPLGLGAGDNGGRAMAGGMAITLVTNVPQGEEEDFEDILQGLTEAGYEVAFVNLLDSMDTLLSIASDSFVWNAVEEFGGSSKNEMGVAGYFELAGIPFTGCGPKTLGLLQDKALTKTVLAGVGCSVVPAVLITPGNPAPDMSHLAWPRMVKYASEDASAGITSANVTNNEAELEAQIKRLSGNKPDAPIFIEEYIDGREILVAVIGNGPDRRVLPPIEISFEGKSKIVTEDAKFKYNSEDFNSVASDAADLTPAEAKAIEEAALLAARATDVQDYCRIDIRLKGATPYIIEINPNPDLTQDHGVGGSAKLAGMNFPELLSTIVESAKARYEQ